MKEKEGETSTHHPNRIHYLFSDDDASEVLSAALLRTLEQQSNPTEPQLEESREAVHPGSTTTSSSSSATHPHTHAHKHTKNPSSEKIKREKEGKKEREERIIIVDVNENGDGIRSVSSLSKDWQVLSATIDNAPTWDGTDDQDASRNAAGGLMLRIEGLSISPLPNSSPFPDDRGKGGAGLGLEGESGRGSGFGAGVGEEEMQTLLEGFDRKMVVLRRVVGQHELQIQNQQQNPGSTIRSREGSGGSAVTAGGDGAAVEILEAGTG